MVSRLLICDDDPDVRSAMRRVLRGFQIVEAGSPREALDALKTQPFDAILCDFSLGAETDGLDLLVNVKLQYPRMIRFLVTGNRDAEVAARAVNDGSVHRLFFKPWNDQQLRAALEIMLHARHPGAVS